jgi:hypothetical protein
MKTIDLTTVTITEPSQVEPSGNLSSLVPCFGTFKCGRLNVPLDYARTGSPNAIIPVTVFPATDQSNYKGSILINPVSQLPRDE